MCSRLCPRLSVPFCHHSMKLFCRMLVNISWILRDRAWNRILNFSFHNGVSKFTLYIHQTFTCLTWETFQWYFLCTQTTWKQFDWKSEGRSRKRPEEVTFNYLGQWNYGIFGNKFSTKGMPISWKTCMRL